MKHKNSRTVETIIIGAGAAGLQAAACLGEEKKSFVILEARHRIGGRVNSIQPHENPVAIVEEGAEFIHGRAALTKTMLAQQGTHFYDLNFPYQKFEKGHFHAVQNYWKTLASFFQKIKKKKIDESFLQFLEAHPQLPLLQRKMASAFIEGFEAAELDQVSSNAMSEMKNIANDAEERALGRPLFGYLPFLQKLAAPFLDRILFEHDVRLLNWKKGEVEVCGFEGARPFVFHAKKLLVTVPVGAMPRLEWSPRPPELDFFQTLKMGQIVKLTLELNPEFFSHFENGVFPFVVSPDLHFKTWWGMEPLRLPFLIAWAGGRHAIELSKLPEAERHELAVRDLAKLARTPVTQVRAQLRQIYEHNWCNDPYSQGAYSYPAVEKPEGKIPTSLTAIQKTIYFAGEAFETEHQGTVEGALRSGHSRAKMLLKDLKRGKKT